jgi:rhodanese-related sulfurtransferase
MFGWGVKKISPGELADKLAQGKQVLIDVREPYEFARGHIKGAVNIPLGELAKKAGKLDSGKETFLICASGSRSNTAASMLKRAGFSDAYSVSWGMAGWRGKVVR